ncbi:MAG: hypothetical protein Ta2G_10390 [Termitinemataceae bacterium]|nr:MAG: hypothetical protein Ta2G_10390 [Termitinemataceae bacterium]
MTPTKTLAHFIVMCVSEFANEKNLNIKEAFQYLYAHKGIQFLAEHYEIEHTLSSNDTLEALTVICKNNGGTIK